MAADKPTTITVRETKPLAARLECRGESWFIPDSPDEKRDLLMAAGALRAMARHFQDCDVLYL